MISTEPAMIIVLLGDLEQKGIKICHKIPRKKKIIFIHGAKDYQEGTVRNLLREQDIEKITTAFRKYKDIEKYCHIASFEELKENEFNLNVPRYVDISIFDEEIDIQKTIEDLRKMENERMELANQVKHDLRELGFVF